MRDFELPTNLTLDEVIHAVHNDTSEGFCLSCGEEAHGVEPDARGYECDACGEPRVYGAEEILLMFSTNPTME